MDETAIGQDSARVPDSSVGFDSALLAESAFALLGCQNNDDVLEVLADFVARLIPDSIVIVNEATPTGVGLVTRRVKGLDDSAIAQIGGRFGFSVIGREYPFLEAHRNDLLGAQLIKVDGGLAALAGEGFAHKLAEFAIHTVGIGDTYTIGISDRETVFGNCHILMREEHSQVPAEIIESFVSHCFSALLGIQRAVSLRREAEESRLLFASMVEGMALHEIIFDDAGTASDYRFLDVNASFESLTGLKATDIIGQTALSVFPQSSPPWIERYGMVATTGVPITFEEYSKEFGKFLKVVAYSTQPGRFAILIDDVTEHRLADEALRTSALLLQAGIESPRETILFGIDHEYRYLYFNSAHMNAMNFAYNTDPSIGLNILELITSDEDRQVAKANYDRALRGEAHSNIRVYGDVQLAYYESFFNPITDSTGATIGASGLAMNVTDRESARIELAKTTSYLENLIGYANAPIIVWDTHKRITRFNRAFEELTGLCAESVIGQGLEALFPDDLVEQSLEYVTRASTGDRWEVVEIPIKGANGTVKTVLWNSATVMDEDGITPIATIAQGQDITERKISEESLRRAVADLERSNRDLEQFAYIASHDLQEPLRMVSLYTELLRKRYRGVIDADADDFIDFAVEGAIRMSHLLEGLLEYSRITTRGETPCAIPAQKAIDFALANLGSQIAESNAAITVGKMPNVIADESQLMRVFQNLVSNSLKFQPPGAVPRVSITAKKSGGLYAFSVKDNGVGIDPLYHDQAFEIFKRLHPRDAYPGTGIGLAVCKRVIERLGGTIWIEDSSDPGTTICFTLPGAR